MPITYLLSYDLEIIGEEDDGKPELRITIPEEDYEKVQSASKVTMSLSISGKNDRVYEEKDKSGGK